jgi:hypothetical protein
VKRKILSFFYQHRSYIETGKILIIALLALVSLFVSFYVLLVSTGTGFQFMYVFIPHLYLIPIILLALWYPKSGLRLIFLLLVSILAFWFFADTFGFEFSIPVVFLYTGLDLATIMVLLLYVKDRHLVEAVITDFMERGEDKRNILIEFNPDFDTIIESLGSPDEYVREEAVQALSGLTDARTILPLIRSLDDDSLFVRRAAAEALGKTNSQKAINPLIKALTEDERCVREAAAEALGHLGEIAIPDLIHSLKNEDWRVRIGSLIALRVSTGHISNIDQILILLSDESPYVRREAVKTLGRIGDSSILPYLIQATKDKDSGVRLRAVRAMVKLGEPKDIIPVLKRCMQDEDGAVRVQAHEELERLKKK